MPQETRVIQLLPGAATSLGKRLDADGYEFRAVPHAIYSYSKPGIVATCYKSHKLVLQGAELNIFLEQYLGQNINNPTDAVDDERIGSDEAGKGDYFGPLVVAAVYVAKKDITRLRNIGVADSKVLSDETIARIAAAIEISTPHSILSLMPPEYNKRQRETGNVNKLLGQLHGEVILNLIQATPCRRVLTDQFGDIEHVRRGLGVRAGDVQLETRPRAEAHVAVAAASILARNAFVRGIQQLSDECGIDLPKGAGDPVERILPKVVAVLGREKLGSVAKLHFRTTEKILDRLF